MLEVVLLVAVLATVGRVVVGWSFVKALHQEAPQVFVDFVLPKETTLAWRRDANRRYWRLILFREYRSALAACPQSRAWASWLFLMHWIQLAAITAFFLAVLFRTSSPS